MKLRLRTAGTGALYRLDVDPGTWKTLLTEVRQAVGLADDAPVVLSLNKKTPLEPAGEGDGLDKLGVCGGDLLWLLSPAPEVPPPAHASSATNGSSTMNGGSSSNAAPAATTAAAAAATGGRGGASSGAAAAAPVAALAPAAGLDSRGSGGGTAAAGSEGDGGIAAAGGEDGAEEGPLAPLPLEEGEAEAEAGSGAAAAARRLLPGVPAKLRLLLCAPSPSDPSGSGSGIAAAPAGGAGATTATTSAGGPTGSGSGSGSGPVLLGALLPPVWRALLVADAVMAESGLQPLQDLPALLSATPAAPPPRQLLYGCSYIGAAAAAAAAVAATQATEGPSLCGGAGAGEDVTMAEAGGSSSVGCSNSGSSAAAVKLVWYGMGRHLVLHGSPVAAVHSVNAGQPTATTTVTINVDLSEYGTAAAPPGGAATIASTIAAAAAAAAAAGLPAALAAHWRRLKDGLGLPLLAAACRAAGVAAPVGLPALPMELQLAVLKKLKARDLVALGATCSYWHGLAYDDALWRPLYESEFAAAAAAAQSDLQLAAARGWAHVFGRRWRERVEARRRRQQFRPAVPGWGPPPLAPLARPPFMPPGSIGGDYDRLPAIGGGMLLPGGGLPGGLPGGFGFGGGVAGRGGGRFGGGGPGGLGGFGVPRPRQWGGGGMGGGWM